MGVNIILGSIFILPLVNTLLQHFTSLCNILCNQVITQKVIGGLIVVIKVSMVLQFQVVLANLVSINHMIFSRQVNQNQSLTDVITIDPSIKIGEADVIQHLAIHCHGTRVFLEPVHTIFGELVIVHERLLASLLQLLELISHHQQGVDIIQVHRLLVVEVRPSFISWEFGKKIQSINESQHEVGVTSVGVGTGLVVGNPTI